jgi:HEAT repeat protein
MFTENYRLQSIVVEANNPFLQFPVTVKTQSEWEVEKLISDLYPDTSWGDRQIAANKIGLKRYAKALPALLDVVLSDPFWMVRCAMIQAIEMIGDPVAIPTLMEVVSRDKFQVVRSYANKVIERLSSK